MYYMRIKPDYNLNSVFEINDEELLCRGIKCIFFDLDSTLMQSKSGKFTEKTLNFLNKLSQNFKIAIITNNCKKHYINKAEEQCSIKIYSNAKKLICARLHNCLSQNPNTLSALCLALTFNSPS